MSTVAYMAAGPRSGLESSGVMIRCTNWSRSMICWSLPHIDPSARSLITLRSRRGHYPTMSFTNPVAANGRISIGWLVASATRRAQARASSSCEALMM